MKDSSYVNKKDQSQSYTDRILYKNNLDAIPLKYDAYHDVLGSDHRPVVLELQLHLPLFQFYDFEQPNLTGRITINQVQLMGVNYHRGPLIMVSF